MKFLAVPGLPSLSQDWPLLCLFILYSTHSHVIFLLSRMPEIKNFSLISHVGQYHILASFHTWGRIIFQTHFTRRNFFTYFIRRDFGLISHRGILYLFHTEGFWNQFTRGLDHILASFHTEGFWTHFTRGVGSYFSLISHGRTLDSFHTAYIIIFQPHSHGGYDYILTYVHCCVGSSGP